MNPKLKFGLLLLAAFVAGAAYGSQVPVVSTIAKKLPGASA